MLITVNWNNPEKTCIYYHFVGQWTWDEFDAVYSEVYAMLDTVSHPVHAIVDLRESHLLPYDTLTQMRRLTFQQHPNGGITIFITENPFARSLFNILTGVLSQAKEIFRIVNTVDKAYALLETLDTENKNRMTL